MHTINNGISNSKLSFITCCIGKLPTVREPINGNNVMIDTNNIEPIKKTINDLSVFRRKFRIGLSVMSMSTFLGYGLQKYYQPVC